MISSLLSFIKSWYITPYQKHRSDHLTPLPPEIIFEIFSYLSSSDLISCLEVSKKWRILAENESLWIKIPLKNAIGKAQWEQHLGNVGLEPPLTKDIHLMLKRPCPIFKNYFSFWKKLKIEDTHVLVLIPETINGKPFTLKLLNKIVESPKTGYPTRCLNIFDSILSVSDQPPVNSHWVLMTKDILPNSRNKDYEYQRNLIREIAIRSGISYEVPCLLDAATCIFIKYIISGQYLFSKKPPTYTVCQEKAESYTAQIIIGGFNYMGLFFNYGFQCDYVGTAAMKKFI